METITVPHAVQKIPLMEHALPVTVSLVTSPSGFDALRSEWNDLLERSEARVFQTYEWQRTWWKYFGEPQKLFQLYVIVVREGHIAIGLAPLFIERIAVLGPLRFRRLAFIGRATSDYLDVLVARGKEELFFTELGHSLRQHSADYDVVLLEDIPDGSQSHTRFRDVLDDAGFSGERFLSEYCPRTTFGETWEETLKTFPPAHRTRLMKSMKKITEEFHAEFERVQDPGQLDSAMDDFITMHQARWNVIGHKGVFADRTTHRFHREVAPLLMKRGWLFLAFLKMSGKRFAGDYGLIFRTECSTYLGGAYDAGDVSRQSPGTILRMHIMRECHALGIQTYDFMRGAERYKYTLGAVDVPNWTMLMFNRGRRATPMLHRARLLRDALVRRSVHEWSSMTHNARKSGVFSKTFASYLVHRCGTLVADALQKAREPEKSLVMGRDRK